MIKQKATRKKHKKLQTMATISPKMPAKPKSTSKSKDPKSISLAKASSNTSRTTAKVKKDESASKSLNKSANQRTPRQKYDKYMEMRASSIIKESGPSINTIKYINEKGPDRRIEMSLHVNTAILEEASKVRQQLQIKLKQLKSKHFQGQQQSISQETLLKDFKEEVELQVNALKRRVKARQASDGAIDRETTDFHESIVNKQSDGAQAKRWECKYLTIRTENDELKKTVKEEALKAKLFKENLNKTQQICEKYQDKIKSFQNDKARIKEQSVQILKLIGSQYADLFNCNPDL